MAVNKEKPITSMAIKEQEETIRRSIEQQEKAKQHDDQVLNYHLRSPPLTSRIKLSRRRFHILILYGICSMEKSFQWINLSTITNKVSFYYQVDNMAVNWTSVLFMITFIPLVLPTGLLIERIGLRWAILIGQLGITIGALIKCFACSPDGFPIVLAGQFVVSLSEQFIFCVPSKIAATWFPDKQVSLATGFGIFGNQCGIAMGFLIPQALLSGMNSQEQIGLGLTRLFYGTAGLALLTMLALLILFDDAPKYPPGAARKAALELRQAASTKTNQNKLEQEQGKKAAEQEETPEKSNSNNFNNGNNNNNNNNVEASIEDLEEARKSAALPMGGRSELGWLLSQIGLLFKKPNCLLLMLAYGINVGAGYSIQTLLNQMIVNPNEGIEEMAGGSKLATWPVDPNQLVGQAGLVIIFSGMLGALFWGYLCDLTHRYKLITCTLYGGFILSILAFNEILRFRSQWALYSASGLMGFTMIGYTVAGLDALVEYTYPIPELISTSLLVIPPQIFGTALTFLGSALLDRFGNAHSTWFLVGSLSIGLLISLSSREDLSRQRVVKERAASKGNI